MARIPEPELERLKNEVSVQRLVEASGLELKKAGKDWLGRCPFHADDTASLVVTPAKNLWHCFGCGSAGGPIDWVMRMQGVSFRHAVELLKANQTDPASAAGEGGRGGEPPKRRTVRALPAPVALDADEQTVLDQVVDYYHATLKQSPEALDYLQARGIGDAAAIERFRLGYANRTLGLRLPAKNRLAGNELRTRLQRIGIYRDSGHEHFNGSLVIPVLDAQGHATEVYGRKLRDDLRPGTPKHLYLPGPHRGVWNLDAVRMSEEVIVCEALIDALTFWCAGYRNVTAAYGIEGVTDELLAALTTSPVKRVLIAFDRDEAGERGAAKLAKALMAAGVDAYRIAFPKGMDANEYALKVTPAAKSLGALIRRAEWLGQGLAPQRQACEPVVEAVIDTPAPVIAPAVPAVEPAPSLAAEAEPLPAAAVPPAPADVAADVSEREVVLRFGEGSQARRWRVRGLPKNLAVGVLKVNVMASVDDGRFHVDTLDLYAARARAVFLQQAASELGLPEPMLKTDLGRVLLKLEGLQDDAIREALAPKAPTEPSMTEAEAADALALLKAPDLLQRILADFEACGIVGERVNKLTAYLAATSRLLDAPLAIVVQSSSAAGKTHLMDAVLACMPPEQCVRYSALTGQSLYYLGQSNLKHKVLAIAEEEGAHRASYALKLLQSEGELTIASTGTDPSTGNLVTQEYRVEGPMSLFMTTTAIDVDEELMNRCLVLSVDEGRAQTQAIHARQRQRRTLDGLLGREKKQAVLDVHRNAQRLLKPLAVVNPHADRLTFLDDRTRTRRDHEKYLGLIDIIALLHQHQRPVRTATAQGKTIEYIEATLDDIAQANALAHEVLGRSLDELPPQTRKLLAELVRWVGERAKAQGLPRPEVRFSRRELREALAWGDTQLKVHLGRLVELELVSAHRLAGGALAYELRYDGDGSAAPHLSGLIDVQALRGEPVAIDAYDAGRSGVNGVRSAPGRGVVGAGSAPGRGGQPAAGPGVARPGDVLVDAGLAARAGAVPVRRSHVALA